jgi:hypothetical protein
LVELKAGVENVRIKRISELIIKIPLIILMVENKCPLGSENYITIPEHFRQMASYVGYLILRMVMGPNLF